MLAFLYVYAADEPHIVKAKELVGDIERVIIFPLMSLLMALAFLLFLWGGYQYVLNAESDGGRETGKQHMLWGIVGLLIMVSAMAILKIAAGTVGVEVPE